MHSWQIQSPSLIPGTKKERKIKGAEDVAQCEGFRFNRKYHLKLKDEIELCKCNLMYKHCILLLKNN